MKRKRGRPPKSETLARQKAEREEAERRKAEEVKDAVKQPEEEVDDIVDAGAIDDPEGEWWETFSLNTQTDFLPPLFKL